MAMLKHHVCLATLILSTSVAAQAVWRRLTPPSSPPVRTDHVCIADLTSLYVVGGHDATKWLSDTWRFAAGKWTQLTPKTPPGPISHACGTWDSARGVPLFFGGIKTGPTGKLADEMWEFANGDWSAKKPATRPAARFYAGMVFEARTRRVILFGGADPRPRGDTWTYKAGTWKQLAPPKSPPARYGHAMAHDKNNTTTLLFGGTSTKALNDTWLWNGTTWRQITTRHTPSARWRASLTFDPGRDRFVLFGGFSGKIDLADTWEFDGVDWIQRKPKAAPSQRSGFGFHSMLGLGYALGFGGRGGKTYSAETWQYHNPNPATFTRFGPGCSGSSGLPALYGSPPWMGEPILISVLHFVPLTPAFLNIGLSNRAWNGVSLPLDLGGIGAPGCRILADPIAIVAMANSLGCPSHVARVPVDTQSIGVTVYLQAWNRDKNANKLGATFTNGGAAKIGIK